MPLKRRTPLLPRVAREAAAPPKLLHPSASVRGHAATMVRKLPGLFPYPQWGIAPEVRNHVGRDAAHQVLRRADAIAFEFDPRGGGYRFVGFEVKVSRADLARELRDPAKSGPFMAFCSAWYLVLPAPWKNYLLSVDQLPTRWGLIEVGSKAEIVLVAEERRAEEPTPGFTRALLRVLTAHAEEAETGLGVEAPLSVIIRLISQTQVGLQCGHVAPRPLVKAPPLAVPCYSCALRLPSDRAAIEAALEHAAPEERDRYRALLDKLDGRPRGRDCGCTSFDAQECAWQALQRCALLGAAGAACGCEDCHGEQRGAA